MLGPRPAGRSHGRRRHRRPRAVAGADHADLLGRPLAGGRAVPPPERAPRGGRGDTAGPLPRPRLGPAPRWRRRGGGARTRRERPRPGRRGDRCRDRRTRARRPGATPVLRRRRGLGCRRVRPSPRRRQRCDPPRRCPLRLRARDDDRHGHGRHRPRVRRRGRGPSPPPDRAGPRLRHVPLGAPPAGPGRVDATGGAGARPLPRPRPLAVVRLAGLRPDAPAGVVRARRPRPRGARQRLPLLPADVGRPARCPGRGRRARPVHRCTGQCRGHRQRLALPRPHPYDSVPGGLTMAELLLLGMTHYPPLAAVDDDMAALMRMMLADPGIPAAAKDPATWAPEARAEWGDDEARSPAAAPRAVLCDGFTRLRAELEAFAPDALVVWGDDQYENSREDVIPPYALLAF